MLPGGRSRRFGARLLEGGVIAGALLVPAVMLPSLRSPFGPPKLAMLALAAAMVLLGLALDHTAYRALATVVKSSRIAWAVGALLALSVLATATAIDARQALFGSYADYRGLATILACATVGAGGVVIAGRDAALLRFWRMLTIVAAGIMGIGILQRLAVLPVASRGLAEQSARVSATLGNSSNFGVLLVLVVPLLIHRAVAERDRVWRLLAMACAALGVVELLWTLSRGAWLGMLAMVVAWTATIVWAGGTGAARRRLLAGLATVAALVVLGAAMTPGAMSRVARIVDIQSRTAQWRVSVWKSAWSMTLDRPLTGFGPNTFRYAYPGYQEAGQVGGATGYRLVESAHNLFLDASTSLGVPGLVGVCVLLALVAVACVRTLAEERDPFGLVPTSGIALIGALVAQQFHYVTMDTGPLIAVLIAFVAASEAARRPSPEVAASRFARALLVVGACVFAVASVAGFGLVAADDAASRGAAAAGAGAPWAVAHAELRRAAALAPWEPAMRSAEGAAATIRLLQEPDPAALTDGVAAFDEALAVTPLDTALAAERANLLLVAGVGASDPELLQRAADAFGEVIEDDPNTGIPRAGRATALLALGRPAEAIADYEAALERSPRDRTAWRNLAAAYRQVGRVKDADAALERAE